MKKFLQGLGTVVVAIIFGGIGLMQCGTIEPSMPDHAIVFTDDQQKVFHSPRHFNDDGKHPPGGLRAMTAKEAKALKYDDDPVCEGRDYFSYNEGSILYVKLMELTGQRHQPRWNDDGTWAW